MCARVENKEKKGKLVTHAHMWYYVTMESISRRDMQLLWFLIVNMYAI